MTLISSLLREPRVFLACALLGTAAGLLAVLLGQAGIELATAPRYHPRLPVAADVRDTVWEARGAIRRRTAGATELPVVESADQGNWVRIPPLSINVPLEIAPSFEEKDVLKTLEKGVVRYPNGVEPGQRGVLVIAGHSTGEPWRGAYRFVFLNARKLKTGDPILVDHRGIRYTYRVTGQRIVDPRRTPFLESTAATPRLSVISCWPLWSTAERLVLDAELVNQARLVLPVSAFDPSDHALPSNEFRVTRSLSNDSGSS